LSLTTVPAGIEADRLLEKARQRLLRFLDQQGAGGVKIHCSAGKPQPCGRSGKSRRVIGLASTRPAG